MYLFWSLELALHAFQVAARIEEARTFLVLYAPDQQRAVLEVVSKRVFDEAGVWVSLRIIAYSSRKHIRMSNGSTSMVRSTLVGEWATGQLLPTSSSRM